MINRVYCLINYALGVAERIMLPEIRYDFKLHLFTCKQGGLIF